MHKPLFYIWDRFVHNPMLVFTPESFDRMSYVSPVIDQNPIYISSVFLPMVLCSSVYNICASVKHHTYRVFVCAPPTEPNHQATLHQGHQLTLWPPPPASDLPAQTQPAKRQLPDRVLQRFHLHFRSQLSGGCWEKLFHDRPDKTGE